MDKNVYLSSKEDPEAIGKVYDFFDSNDVKIRTLRSFPDFSQSLKGKYVVRYSRINDYNNFLKNVAKKFGESEEKLTKPTFENWAEGSFIGVLSVVSLIVCILTTTMTSFFYSVKCFKKVGIMKLFGWSVKDIFIDLFSFIFSLNIFCSIVLNFFITFFYKNVPISFILRLFACQFLVTVLIFLGTIPCIFLFKKYSISDLINSKNPTRIVFGLVFFTKQLMIIMLLFFSYSVPYVVKKLPEQLDKLKKWSFISNLAMIEYVGKNDNAFIGSGGDPTE